ncbi:ferredoxin [Streptomyces sp. NPDC048342]|uniref:ferredoxin n=1 Tax=unclassified Streptomyces TaxID=2593676 RepID=UPI003436411F
MKVVVELSQLERYVQYGCLAPETFRMPGGEALMYDPNPRNARRDQVLRAAAACPVQAIVVDRLESQHATAEASPP